MMRVMIVVLAGCLLAGCTDPAQESAYQAYRKDRPAALREVAHCQSNYNAISQTPQCRAAFQVNSELFPMQ